MRLRVRARTCRWVGVCACVLRFCTWMYAGVSSWRSDEQVHKLLFKEGLHIFLFSVCTSDNNQKHKACLISFILINPGSTKGVSG